MTAKTLRKLIMLSGQMKFKGKAYSYPLWNLAAIEHSSGNGWYIFTPKQCYDTPEEAIFEAIRVRYNL